MRVLVAKRLDTFIIFKNFGQLSRSFFKFLTVRLGTECCNHSILCSGWGGKARRLPQQRPIIRSDAVQVRAMIPLAVSCQHVGPGKNWWYFVNATHCG